MGLLDFFRKKPQPAPVPTQASVSKAELPAPKSKPVVATTPSVQSENQLGQADFIPMIASMKAFRICSYPKHLSSPAEFSKTTSLMKGDAVFPNQESATRRNTAAALASLSTNHFYKQIVAACPDWPDDVRIAFRGLLAFAAGEHDLAFQCARLALQQQNMCLLARQIMSLLSDTNEHRIRGGDPAYEQRLMTEALASASERGTKLVLIQMEHIMS